MTGAGFTEGELGAGLFQRAREAAHLGHRHGAAVVRQAVVAPALVVERGVRPLVAFDNQPVLLEALDQAVERSGAQGDLAFGPPLDFLDDRVAMLLAVGQREQDLEHRRGEREERVRVEARSWPSAQL